VRVDSGSGSDHAVDDDSERQVPPGRTRVSTLGAVTRRLSAADGPPERDDTGATVVT